MAITESSRAFVLIPASLLLGATVLTATPAVAQTAPANLDPVLRHRSRQFTGRSRVLVEYRDAVDVRAVTSVRGRAGRKLANGRMQIAEIDNIGLASLARDPRVARLSIDRETFATMERTGAAIGAESARADFGVTGRGVGVAVIDSGISALNDDLLLSASGRPSSAVVHFKDFTRDQQSGVWTPDVPVDDFGHGTHVAGIIRGSGYDSGGRRRGIAPNARLIGLKVLDRDGRGHISDVIEALDYAVAMKRQLNIRVINISIGAGVHESYRVDPLAQATRRAVDAGIVVVAAAGNLGHNDDGETQYGGITAPGNAPWVITVGAANHHGTARRGDDTVASFSSRGPTWIDFVAKPDLLAPGVGIESLADPRSTLYTALADYRLDGTRQTPFQPYLSLSGTSMAAPVVSGAVALLLEANPSLTPNAVKAILEYTAQTRRSESTLAQGAGLLNVRGALRMAGFFDQPRTGVGRAGDTIEAEWIPWSRELVWGNYRVTGGVPLPHSNAWATGVAWGALRTRSGAPVVWGAQSDENIVWSTRARTNENIVWSTYAPENDNIVWSTRARNNDNIVWSTAGAQAENIVWSTAANGVENIVWSTHAPENDNIVWSTAYAQNVVWGADCQGADCLRRIWGARSGGGIWGTADSADNIVWSTAAPDNDNIVWSTAAPDNDNIVWSTFSASNDNIVWSTSAREAENIVWSTYLPELVVWPAPAAVAAPRRLTATR